MNFGFAVNVPLPLGVNRKVMVIELSGGIFIGRMNDDTTVNSGESAPGPCVIVSVSQPLFVMDMVISCGR